MGKKFSKLSIFSTVAAVFWSGVSVTAAAESNPLTDPLAQTHMSEAFRTEISKVIVLPSTAEAGENVTGSYNKETLGVLGGAAKGGRLGDGVGTEVGGIRVQYPIPVLRLPGQLLGAIAGKTQQEIQDFRDAMTRDLAEAADIQLTNDALASDVFWQLRNYAGLEPKIYALSTPIPEESEAILYVALTDVTIEVQGKEAIVSTKAEATLRRLPENKDIYRADVSYIDRDTLTNWRRDDHALWRNYASFARHYLAREIAGEIFGHVDLNHTLRPSKSKSVAAVKKNDWHGVSKTATPTLTWELHLLGDDVYGAWSDDLANATVSWDVEVYDLARPVYSARNVAGTAHTLDQPLPCKTSYRWSVRPSFTVDGRTRIGDWMRANGGKDTKDGSSGLEASQATAYLYDFPRLDLKCRD